MSIIGLCYAAILFVAGFFVAYFWIIARTLAKQVRDLTEQLRAAYDLDSFIAGLKESESEKIKDSKE